MKGVFDGISGVYVKGPLDAGCPLIPAKSGVMESWSERIIVETFSIWYQCPKFWKNRDADQYPHLLSAFSALNSLALYMSTHLLAMNMEIKKVNTRDP